MEQINSVIDWFADIQFALFPLQCFPLGTCRQFCVTFGIHHKQLFQGSDHSVCLWNCLLSVFVLTLFVSGH